MPVDRSARIARFIASEVAPISEPIPDLMTVCSTVRDVWPDVTQDEFSRAFDIAIELRRLWLAEQWQAVGRSWSRH